MSGGTLLAAEVTAVVVVAFFAFQAVIWVFES